MNWQQAENKRRPFFTKGRKLFRAALNVQNKPFIDSIANAESTDKMLRLANNYKAPRMPMQQAYEKLYKDCGSYFAVLINGKLTKGIDGSFYEVYMEKFAREEAGDRITDVTGTTEEEIKTTTKRVIEQGISEGKSIYQMSKEITKTIEKINLWRAERIVRTEVISASNRGSLLGAETTGLDLKKVWLTAGDNRVRKTDGHASMNHQPVPIKERFSNGMLYPGDPAGGAKETIQCRCSIYYEKV